MTRSQPCRSVPSLCRVLPEDVPIRICDEAPSALDSEAELAIQEQLASLMQGKTVIAIAHRLSTIARMDRLIVLEQGRIAEQGTHAELLQMGGLYAKLWSHQSGGFLPLDGDPVPIDVASEVQAALSSAARDEPVSTKA